MLEDVTQEAYRIAELVERADSRAASRSATEEAEELRAGASLFAHCLIMMCLSWFLLPMQSHLSSFVTMPHLEAFLTVTVERHAYVGYCTAHALRFSEHNWHSGALQTI